MLRETALREEVGDWIVSPFKLSCDETGSRGLKMTGYRRAELLDLSIASKDGDFTSERFGCLLNGALVHEF